MDSWVLHTWYDLNTVSSRTEVLGPSPGLMSLSRLFNELTLWGLLMRILLVVIE